MPEGGLEVSEGPLRYVRLRGENKDAPMDKIRKEPGPEKSTAPVLCLFGANCKIANCTKSHSTLDRSLVEAGTTREVYATWTAGSSTDTKQEDALLGGNLLAKYQSTTAEGYPRGEKSTCLRDLPPGDTAPPDTSSAIRDDPPTLGGIGEILEKMADAETQDAQAAIDKARKSAQETILNAERPLAQLRGPARVSDQVRALEAKIKSTEEVHQ